MKYLSLGLLLTGVIVLGNQSQGQAANLFRNSSFEVGSIDPGNGYVSLDAGSTAIEGWEVTRGGIDYMGSIWNAANGNRSLDLNASPSAPPDNIGGIKQTVTTIPGALYSLTLSLATNPGITGLTTIRASIGDKWADFDSDPTQTSGNHLNWDSSPFWQFFASSNQTTVEFFTLQSSSPYGGPALDAVSLTQANTLSSGNQGIPESTPVIGVLVFGALALSLSREKNP